MSNRFWRVAGGFDPRQYIIQIRPPRLRRVDIGLPGIRTQTDVRQADVIPRLPAFPRRPNIQPRIVSPDEACWLYHQCREKIRRVDPRGRIVRIQNSPPRSPNNRMAIQRDKQSPSNKSCRSSSSKSSPSCSNASGSKALISQGVKSVGPVSTASSDPATYYTASEGESEPEVSMEFILEYRQKALDSYYTKQTAWEEWHKAYAEILEAHERGTGPNVEGWIHDCTRSEFEAQYLKEGSRRAKQYAQAEAILCRNFDLAAQGGAEPFEWQDWAFPDDGHYYYESEEAALAERAPTEAIRQWMARLPARPQAMAGSELADADYNPARYGGDHPVETPDDVHMPESIIETWESLSVKAEGRRRKLIDEANTAAIPSWSLAGDAQ